MKILISETGKVHEVTKPFKMHLTDFHQTLEFDPNVTAEEHMLNEHGLIFADDGFIDIEGTATVDAPAED